MNKLIACEFRKKGVNFYVFRDKYGHWSVRAGCTLVQEKLNASEIVRYLCNACDDGS